MRVDPRMTCMCAFLTNLATPRLQEDGPCARRSPDLGSGGPITAPVFRRTLGELGSILRPVTSFSEVAAVYQQLHSRGGQFVGCLEEALSIAGLQQEAADLFAAIFSWALQALDEDSMPLAFPKEVGLWLPGTGPQKVAYTAAQCRGLLANALVLNVRDTCEHLKTPRFAGGLDLSALLSSPKEIAKHKVACLLAYFQAQRGLGSDADKRLVTWERRAAGVSEEGEGKASLAQFKDWACREGATRICCDPSACSVSIHEGSMEAIGEADAFVNFANPTFGYGHFIASCTQEEILQVCCPEFNVGMLHQGRMTDSEVISTEGAVRFSAYTGYGWSFRYAGPWSTSPQETQAILTMDATTQRHLSEEMNLRDIRKAYLCFQGQKAVTTGKWGCGIFGGLPVHKFLQQVLAATLAGCSLHFSSFGATNLCDRALEVLEDTKPTAAELLQAILQTSNRNSLQEAEAFLTAFCEVLRQMKEPHHFES